MYTMSQINHIKDWIKCAFYLGVVFSKTTEDHLSAFCRVQRTPMRFRADAVQSTTDALKQCIFSYSRGFITTV